MMIYCDLGYLKDGNSAYIGSMMGRVANRIANGEFELGEQKHVLAKNFLGKHSLHGGVIGFDKFNWDSHVDGTTVYLTHVSPDEYEGYPGTVLTTIECRLSDDNGFTMNISAVTSKPTIINMSNHSYFNLAGHGAGYKELYKHVVTINADKVLKISPEQVRKCFVRVRLVSILLVACVFRRSQPEISRTSATRALTFVCRSTWAAPSPRRPAMALTTTFASRRARLRH